MATKRVVVLECDFCGTNDKVETHIVRLDKKTVEIEGCEKCWKPHAKSLTSVLTSGRKVAHKTQAAA